MLGHLIVPVADLVLGASCAGCGAPALGLCRSCGEAAAPEPAIRWPSPTPDALRRPPVLPASGGVNADVLRRVLIAWKEEGVTALTGVLSHHVAAAVLMLDSGRPLSLVPVPTSARSRRARGADLVDDLARAARGHLVRLGVDVVVTQALAYRRTTEDQAGLGAAARAANLAGAFRVRAGRLPAGRDVVVIDDILTTGATVAEAVRVLSEEGRRPIGAAVAGATGRLSETVR
ncbi:MAG: ComF family protein [Aeromicrobium sp.]|nr:ComF family protein [Aeromicrobium sp.]